MVGMYDVSLYTCVKFSRVKKKLKKKVQERRSERIQKIQRKESHLDMVTDWLV